MEMTKKISLWLAIIININIVIGGGFFLNAPSIAGLAGKLAPLSWVLCGLLLLPLVLVLAALSRTYPTAGGIYTYSYQQFGKLIGFISGWGYFIGTAAGNAVVVHGFSTLAQKLQLLPMLSSTPATDLLIVDTVATVGFTIANFYNVQVLSVIQLFLTVIKMVPLLLVALALPFLYKLSHFTEARYSFDGAAQSIPLVLFAYIGVEVCCAITPNIENGQKNASRSMIIALGIIVFIYAFLQWGLIAIHGTVQTTPFHDIIPMLTSNPLIVGAGNTLVSLAMLSSYLGGFYGMLYSNNFNLLAILQGDTFNTSDTSLVKVNRYGAPVAAIIIQSVIVLALIFAVQDLAHLITMGDFGMIIAYLLSTFAFLRMSAGSGKAMVTGLLSLASCGIFTYFCINNLKADGVYHLYPFLAILGLGVVVYFIQQARK